MLGTIWVAPLPEGVDFTHQLWFNGRRFHTARQTTRSYEKATPNSFIFKVERERRAKGGVKKQKKEVGGGKG